MSADVVPHLWSGLNSAKAREKGAEALAKLIHRLVGRYRSVHIVGHSHGGNVAVEAAEIVRWSDRTRSGVASVVAVGTPFIRPRVTVAQRLGAWAFLAILASCVPGVTLMGLYHFIRPVEGDTGPVPFTQEGLTGAIIAIVPILAVLTVVLSVAWRGVSRIRRATRRPNARRVLTVVHPNDEAIAFLRRAEVLDLEPFPPWSIWRSSQNTAVVWASGAALLLGLITILGWAAWGFRYVADDIPLVVLWRQFAQRGLAQNEFTWIILSFVAVYFLVRLFAGLLSELMLRGRLNRWVGDILRGMALGSDTDTRVGEVSTRPHYSDAKFVILADETAARMQEKATSATLRLFDKYRWGLFSIAEQDSKAMADIVADAMTWDSLIHTTYFDQPEIADMIGDHMVSEEGITTPVV